MDKFDLKKYLAEGKLNEMSQPYYQQIGKESEVEDIAYYLDMFKRATNEEEALSQLSSLEYAVKQLMM
jgi:hypothetical protein